MKSGNPARQAQLARELLSGSLLFFATAAFILWQNSQIAILWDLSYLLDTSWRIALGQVPYRDFPLVHAPLTFLIQAAVMRIAGRHYQLQIAYTALAGGLGTVVSWRILLRTMAGKIQSAWAVSLLLAAPLTVLGIYSIYPHPIYDCDCACAILVPIWMLQRIATGKSNSGFLAGAAVVVPVFFKQNMGLPFLFAIVCGIVLLLLVNRTSKTHAAEIPSAILLQILAGTGVATLAALATLQLTVGLDNYLHWTVQFAAQRRLPGLGPMLTVYRQPSFVWTLPCVGIGLILLCLPLARRARVTVWAQILAMILLSAPLVASLVYLFLNDDLDERADNLLALWPMLLILAAVVAWIELRKGITLNRLLPIFVLAAIHGTFLSQQLWGSTYAIWPLLLMLIAQMLAAVPAIASRIAPALASVVCATFMVCGGLYATGHERMNYLNIPDQPLSRATLPALGGMADRGPYLADFEQLIRFANAQIPAEDGILLLPGEEPFYFATGRTPQFPIQIFDQTTDPYTPEQLLVEAPKRNIHWVIVKTRLQSNEDPLPDSDRTISLLKAQFQFDRRISGYDIYRRP